jgi:hypothetical protein
MAGVLDVEVTRSSLVPPPGRDVAARIPPCPGSKASPVSSMYRPAGRTRLRQPHRVNIASGHQLASLLHAVTNIGVAPSMVATRLAIGACRFSNSFRLFVAGLLCVSLSRTCASVFRGEREET